MSASFDHQFTVSEFGSGRTIAGEWCGLVAEGSLLRSVTTSDKSNPGKVVTVQFSSEDDSNGRIIGLVGADSAAYVVMQTHNIAMESSIWNVVGLDGWGEPIGDRSYAVPIDADRAVAILDDSLLVASLGDSVDGSSTLQLVKPKPENLARTSPTSIEVEGLMLASAVVGGSVVVQMDVGQCVESWTVSAMHNDDRLTAKRLNVDCEYLLVSATEDAVLGWTGDRMEAVSIS